jgi:hypothetical protein
MFQDAISIMQRLECGVGNAFSFAVLRDPRNGCFFEHGNARMRCWCCEIAEMDAFSNVGMLKYSIAVARSPKWLLECGMYKY